MMKSNKILSIFLCAVVCVAIISCKSNDSDEVNISVVENAAAIKFDNDVLDFHRLNAGEKVTGSFHFRNVGDHDLVISDVSTSCGCTVADYPHGAIKPGEDGMITVSYDSKGSNGVRIQKTVTVQSNTKPSVTVLKIVADVE